MKLKSQAIFAISTILLVLIFVTPHANGQNRTTEITSVAQGKLDEIRFRPFVYIRIGNRQILDEVERVIEADPSGQLMSVIEPADADFFVAFISKAADKVTVAKSGFVLPEPNQITSDHTGQMIVYTKDKRGRVRIVWTDAKGSNRPERAMFEFLRALDRNKQAMLEMPIKELNDLLASNEVGIEPLGNATKPTFTYRARAKYTEKARVNRVSGNVVMSVILNSDGELSDLFVIRGLPHGLTASSIEALKKMRFTPATQDGKPVSIRTYLEFNFAIY